MPDNEDLPAPSILASDEAALLQHGGVRPPTQLGSCGRVGKFEIIKPLGQGGMGHVYAATEPVTGTTVALKMLKSEFMDDPRVAQIFLREARHMYQLSHPSILKVLEVSGPDEGPFFVMPLVPGGSLAKRISEGGILDYGDTLTIGSQVAEGLAHAHSKGLIHRDLKPANVLLDEGGRALITDFGLVRSYLGDTMVNANRSAPEGTPAYMSPSVAAGQAEDTRCDIYAFGAMLYEMLAGHAPYVGRDAASVMQAVLHGPPQSLAAVNPKAPRGLVAITEWCMARELRDRYASMEDVLADLQRIQSSKAPHGPHGAGIGGARKRRIVLTAAIAGLLLAAIGGTGWLLADRVLGSSTRQCNKAGRLIAAGHHAKAAAIYRSILLENPNNVRAILGLGRLEETQGRLPQASTLYRRARTVDPSSTLAAEMLTRNLLRIGHVIPARHELELWLKADPDSKTAKKLLGELEAAEARIAEAHPPPPTAVPPSVPGPPPSAEPHPSPETRQSSTPEPEPPPTERPSPRPSPPMRGERMPPGREFGSPPRARNPYMRERHRQRMLEEAERED